LKLRAAIVRERPWCEYGQNFPDHFPAVKSQDPSHLFGGRAGKYDFVWNICSTSRDVNGGFCERYKTDGRILGLWIRDQQGLIDVDQFRLASGYNIDGWLAIVNPHFDWVRPYLDALRLTFP